MDWNEYRKRGKEMMDFVADYMQNVQNYRTFPKVDVGYLKEELPNRAPEKPEDFDVIVKDFTDHIFRGLTHWISPQMHAYFPASPAPSSFLGVMIEEALNCMCHTWASSPVATELEVVVTDWLAKMFGLPKQFLHSAAGDGGGVLKTTTSEGTFLSLMAARTRALESLREQYNGVDSVELLSKLVAYTSEKSHSSVEKAGLMSCVKIRYVPCDEKLSMNTSILEGYIASDREMGLYPFFVCATLGTTGCCAFDNLKQIATICAIESLWLHVDAAYAGAAFVCPEFRHWLEGIEFVNSIVINPSKWMLVHMDCSALWIRDSTTLERAVNSKPVYLKQKISNAAVDFEHWQLCYGKRFRALKMWYMLNAVGVKGMQEHIRKCIRLAKYFESLVLKDDRFEIPVPRNMALIVLRLKGENHKTEELLKTINDMGALYCIPTVCNGKYCIRFVLGVSQPNYSEESIARDWQIIQKCVPFSTTLDQQERIALLPERHLYLPMSLLLSNDITTPTVIDASYLALIKDQKNAWSDEGFTKALQEACRGIPNLNPRFQELLQKPSELSLDSHLDLLSALDLSQGQRKKSI